MEHVADSTPTGLEHLAQGVDHAAFPTFDPAGTVRFYHDILGFPIVHSVCAVGWGPADHPDFVHFFFDIGKGDRIAFFYYFGVERFSPDGDAYATHGPEIPGFFRDSRHLAIHVDSVDVLEEYQRRLQSNDWHVEMRVKHETIESIYTHDPNGYLVEFTYPTRATTVADDDDAELTVRALLDVVASSEKPSLAALWARKAELILEHSEDVSPAAELIR
ncbi:VOC family protein [Mycobacterium paraintracellulare]|uniref:VOC family protein n=1 Tax=Mycobacterium paraintracellulare TaxID=1138383 RepID=UPI001916C231|nr:VOC family protein [Mycobacterium paraintracellulare]